MYIVYVVSRLKSRFSPSCRMKLKPILIITKIRHQILDKISLRLRHTSSSSVLCQSMLIPWRREKTISVYVLFLRSLPSSPRLSFRLDFLMMTTTTTNMKYSYAKSIETIKQRTMCTKCVPAREKIQNERDWNAYCRMHAHLPRKREKRPTFLLCFLPLFHPQSLAPLRVRDVGRLMPASTSNNTNERWKKNPWAEHTTPQIRCVRCDFYPSIYIIITFQSERLDPRSVRYLTSPSFDDDDDVLLSRLSLAHNHSINSNYAEQSMYRLLDTENCTSWKTTMSI